MKKTIANKEAMLARIKDPATREHYRAQLEMAEELAAEGLPIATGFQELFEGEANFVIEAPSAADLQQLAELEQRMAEVVSKAVRRERRNNIVIACATVLFIVLVFLGLWLGGIL